MTRGLSEHGVVDYIQFIEVNEAEDNKLTMWIVNLTFLLSGWECLFGRGCPGHFGKTDRYITPDLGCCTTGFYVTDNADFENITKRIEQLQPEDWDDDLRRYVEKNGWWFQKEKSEGGRKSRTVDGGCVFANRAGGSAGKPGCAFIAMANRHGENVDDSTADGHESHTKYMPGVCHSLPLKFTWTDGVDNPEKYDNHPSIISQCEIDPWDASRWTENAPEINHDQWMTWWCVDAPEAYGHKVPLYIRMADTLVSSMGQKAYDRLVELIEAKQPKVDPMAAEGLNGGRPLLPLLIGGREPKRPYPPFDEALDKMKKANQ